MKKKLYYIAILAIITLFTAGMTSSYLEYANTLKSRGTGTMKFGASTDICGLCSEIPGGKTAWEVQQKGDVSNTESDDLKGLILSKHQVSL